MGNENFGQNLNNIQTKKDSETKLNKMKTDLVLDPEKCKEFARKLTAYINSNG